MGRFFIIIFISYYITYYINYIIYYINYYINYYFTYFTYFIYYTTYYIISYISEKKLKGELADNMIEGTKNKMRTILRIGLLNGHDSLVLGALGCGAFCNPPSHIARLFHEVFEEHEFKNKYRHICFAILDDHNSHKRHNPEGNYLPFVKEFINNHC